jgi:hypothetical protein
MLLVTFVLFAFLENYYDKKNTCKDNDKQFFGDCLMNYVLILLAIGMIFSIIYYLGNQFVSKIKGDVNIQVLVVLGVITLQCFLDAFLPIWLSKLIDFLGKKEYKWAKKRAVKKNIEEFPPKYKKPFNVGMAEIELTLVMMKVSCLLIALCVNNMSMILLFASSLIKVVFDGPSSYYKAKIEQKKYESKLLKSRKKFAFCYIAAYYIFAIAFVAAILETSGVLLSSAATAFGIMSGFLLLLAKPYLMIIWDYIKTKAISCFVTIIAIIIVLYITIKKKIKNLLS